MEFVRDVVARLERTGATYAITGSIASNYWGVPRLTHDVDIVIVLTEDSVQQIVQAFPSPYYLSEPAAKEAVRAGGMFNVIHTQAGFKADLWISTNDAFNQSLLVRRRRVEILPGLSADVGSPEDVLLHKLVWHKITPSERQLADAAGIAAVQKDSLDVAYLTRWATQQSTSELLAAVLSGKGLKQT